MADWRVWQIGGCGRLEGLVDWRVWQIGGCGELKGQKIRRGLSVHIKCQLMPPAPIPEHPARLPVGRQLLL